MALGAGAFAADPQIAAYTDEPDPVPAGGIVTLTAIVDNNAIAAATGTRLTVPVPAGAVFVSAPGGCSLLAAAPPLPLRVECVLGTLGGSGTDVRTLPIRFRAVGPGPATIVSQATVTAANDTNLTNNVQNQTTTVVSGANLALAKAGSPDPVVGGGNVTYALTVANAGPNAAGTLQVVDDLPPSVRFVSSSGSGWSCARVAQRVTCNHPGPVAVGASAPVLTLVGTVEASGGTVTNTASVAPGAAGGVADPDTTDNTAIANTTVLPGADVRIAGKAVISGTPVVAGQDVSFRIQPRNAGPAAALDAVVTDPLPAGWTFVSATGPNWSCSHAAGAVSCSRGSFPAGTTDDIVIVATAPDNAAVGPGGRSFTNTASIASASADPNLGNNAGSVNVQVLPDGADLQLAKVKSPNPVAQGAALTSDITVTNNGPRVATGPLRVVEVLDGETYTGFVGAGWSCTPNGNVVVCDHPNPAPGLAVGSRLPILRILGTATQAGAVSNTACSGSSVPPGSGAATARPPLEGDANATNDCVTRSSTSTTVRPDLAIAKLTSTPAGGDKQVSAGESFVDFTLTVSNVSTTPETATGVRIVDDVPSGLFIAGRTTIAVQVLGVTGATPATFDCAVAGARVTCSQSGGQFAQGDVATIRVRVTRPFNDGGPFTNTATVANTAQGDPNPANNSASDTVTVEPVADIEMTGKSVTPNPLRAGENATYTLSFRNNGPSTAQNVALADSFGFAPGDSGVTVLSVASSKAGSSCSVAPGAVLAPGNDAFGCTIGALANGETQSVTLVVRPNFQSGNAVRTVGNTASVTTSTVENPAGGDNGNNRRSASLTVNPAQVDLVTNKADVSGSTVVDPVGFTPATGAFLSYAVRITNNGPSFATNVRIAETMVPPAGKRVRFVCDTTSFNSSVCNAPSLCSVTNTPPSGAGVALPTFSCAVPAGNATTGPGVGELAANHSKTIFLRFLAPDQPEPRGDVFNNTAVVSSNEPDTQLANNTEGEQTTTRQRVDLRVTKSASASSVSLQQPFDWIVTVQNRGPGNSLQTDLTDTLPAGVEVTGPVTWVRTLQPANGTCSVANRTVSCALGQLDGAALPNPGSATITIPVRFTSFPAGGSATNSATVDADPAKTGGIDTPGGNNTGTHSITVLRSSIAGTVFQDRLRDGANAGTPQAAASEPRLAGVRLRLTGTDAFGNTVDRQVDTDADGRYRFDNLAPADLGGYTVTQVQPAGFVNGPADAPVPGAGGGVYARGGAAGNSAWTAIALAAGTDLADYNFPEVRRPSLSGRVYVDVDGNGAYSAGDTDIVGATVVLRRADTGAPVATATTDAQGGYRFADLDPLLVYIVEEPLPATPANLANGPVNPGLIDGLACAAGCTAQPDTPTPGTDRIAAIDLGAGADGTQFNFGEIPSGAAIGGRVWLDVDDNGVIDANEAGIPGVTIELTGIAAGNRPVVRQTVTDAGGNYAFSDLPPGLYTVREPQQPAGTVNGVTRAGTTGGTATGVATTPSTIAAIPLAANQVSTANDFAEVPTSEISGIVYADDNDNGIVDGGESGLAGVTLVLTGTDDLGNAVSIQVQTGPDGRYGFPNLRPGTYTVTQPAQPAGTINGITSPGSAGGNATGVGTVPSAIAQIALGPGVRSTGNNFGEITESPDLRVSKRLEGAARFTVGFVGRYTIGVRNAGNAPTVGTYTVRDRLPPGLTLAGVPGGTGWSCTGAANDSRFECTSGAVIAGGASAAATIEVPVNVAASAAANSPVNNLVLVEGGGEIPMRAPTPAERAAFDSGDFNALPVCTPAVEHNACRVPTPVQRPAAVSGTVWFDGGSAARVLDADDRRLAGWQVEIVDPATNQIVGRATTGADGRYRVDGLLPGVPLAVRFREPGSGIVYGYPVNGDTAPGSSGAGCNPQAGANGTASSCVGTGANPALTVILAAGEELPQQSLPVDPSGVVYDSGTRQPVPGSIVTLAPVGACPAWDPSAGLVGATLGGYTINGPATSMTVGSDGFYQFLFSPSAPARCTFGLTVTPPAGYTFRSAAIPPTQGPLNAPGGPTAVFPVQPQAGAPTGPVGSATTYYLSLISGSAGANVIHNHIPLDPVLPGAIGLTKTGDKAVAEIGDSVRYTVTVSVLSGALPRQTTVVDRLPAGFTYIPGTAMVGDVRIADPQGAPGALGPRLAFNLGPMGVVGPGNTLVLRYRVRVGVGAASGDGINSARAHACSAPAGCVDGSFNPLAGSVATNEARHRVRVEGGVFGTEACVLGKVYVDCNNNQTQDREELGIPGVRLVMQDGTTLISDSEGKYSLCGLPPRSAVLRADPNTLPRGARLVTTSNRNLGDAGSLWLDLKSGELHRADFAEGSCSNAVLEQVKARRAQGEVRAPEDERPGRPALRFDSKAHGLDSVRSPQQGTDGANQPVPKPREPSPAPASGGGAR